MRAYSWVKTGDEDPDVGVIVLGALRDGTVMEVSRRMVLTKPGDLVEWRSTRLNSEMDALDVVAWLPMPSHPYIHEKAQAGHWTSSTDKDGLYTWTRRYPAGGEDVAATVKEYKDKYYAVHVWRPYLNSGGIKIFRGEVLGEKKALEKADHYLRLEGYL